LPPVLFKQMKIQQLLITIKLNQKITKQILETSLKSLRNSFGLIGETIWQI